MRVASARRKRRSWVTKTSAPARPSRNCSSQSIDSMSRWLVGSSSSSRSGRGHQRAREQHAALHAARQARRTPRRRRGPGASAPRSRAGRAYQPCAASMRACTAASASVSTCSSACDEMVELGEQRADVAQRRRRRRRTRCRRRRCGTSCASRATRGRLRRRTSPSSARISPASSRSNVDLPAPLRPMSAMRSPGSMDEIDVLEQQRAADRIVDVDEIDQGHRKISGAQRLFCLRDRFGVFTRRDGAFHRRARRLPARPLRSPRRRGGRVRSARAGTRARPAGPGRGRGCAG